MKKSNLKSLINRIIREAVVNKLGEGQPIGGVKNDHPFDAGRNNVMKAVNIGEELNNTTSLSPYQKQVVNALINRGFKIKKYQKLTNNQVDVILELPYNNIAHNHEYRFCNVSPNGRINRNQMDINTFLKGVIGEKVGFDGKYVDDMESGVAVKKLHSLDETPDYKQKFVYPENFKQVKNYIRIVRRPETNEFVVTWYENGRLNEDKSYFTDDIKDAWDTFNHMKSSVDKANSTMNENKEDEIPGKFVNRGEVKLEGGLDYDTAYKIAKYHWDIFGQSGKDDRGVWNFQTRGNRWCCAVGKLNGQPAMLSVTTTPGRLQLLVGDELGLGLNEMSSTGGSSGSGMGYSTPYAFSKKGGSKRALDVTTKMGYKKVKDID